MPDGAYRSMFTWPWLAAASAGHALATAMERIAESATTRDEQTRPEPGWTTPNDVMLDLPTMRLRAFGGAGTGRPTLICAPFALHSPVVVDFAAGHSVVERLLAAASGPVYATHWRSATPEMRAFSIDAYLAEINVAVDEIGPPVNLVGACQGGWMALLFAARFPKKASRLVIAGAPVDIGAAPSILAQIAGSVPLDTFEELVRFGGGRMLGHKLQEFWTSPRPSDGDIDGLLQIGPGVHDAARTALRERFRAWDAWTLDLPGAYYLDVVERLFRQNRIAGGMFTALGRLIDLKRVRVPLVLLAGRDDDLVAPAQVFAAADHVGTKPEQIVKALEPCGHLGLFMGRQTLETVWPSVGRWLQTGEWQMSGGDAI